MKKYESHQLLCSYFINFESDITTEQSKCLICSGVIFISKSQTHSQHTHTNNQFHNSSIDNILHVIFSSTIECS